ncbi:MAG: DUF2309 domain-containing protein [Planctomycetaceae bacterium]|nr:DUF2309 domain-containing protein [Planctomycetaceae bacterium]
MTSNSAPAALSTDTAIPEQIEKEVRKLAELLPLQGPITAFAFLNPLQGMEHRPFAEVLRSVGEIYGCEPFLTENRYRQKMSRGRITDQDLREVLLEEPDFRPEEMVGGLVRRIDLRLSMLQYPLTPGTENELRWMIAESDSLQRFRPEMSHESRDRLLEETQHWIMRDKRSDAETDAASDGSPAPGCSHVIQETLDQFGRRTMESWTEKQWERVCLNLLWRLSLCRLATSPVPAGSISCRARLRDLLMEETSVDSDELVNEVLVGFCAAYLDQGYAHWRLPNRDAGFLRSFCDLFQTPSFGARRWLRDLPSLLEPIATGQQTAAQSIQESLTEFGVTDAERIEFLRASLLALRGWAGMIWQTEDRPDRVYRYSPPGTLTEFLAIRLILDRLASRAVAVESSDARGSLAEIRKQLRSKSAPAPHSVNEQRAFLIMQLAQIHGWCPRMLAELSQDNWSALLKEIDGFCQLERRRIFHLAFERQLARRALDAVAVRAAQPLKKPEQPQLQIVTCIDAREESFRRHLEELAPDVETFGNAGFFCVPMYYRGAGEATFTALCPIVIKPQNWIVEDVVYALEDSHRQRAAARRILGRATHGFDTGTRSSLTGAVLTALLGPLATAPLLGRILFPRTMAQMHRTARRFVAPPAITRLRLERPEGTKAGPTEEGIGFTLTEMVNMSERSLRDIGLTSNFARLVMFLGHGSNCLNNPHESAYHCGACSGSPGGANARALAAMLNDVRVRRQLKERGLVIPEETYFVGGLHNTATEEITFYDLELLPTSHLGSLRLARDLYSRVAERNAHERCRRFESARLDLSPSEALLHVQERAEDLAQTRPEYGNCTNAVCFVGRRSRIRGLYLDRRSFMMSYDKSQDNEKNMILARILGAVIPVCEGINMLYTLSAIDSRGWGSGTKLPHNVTSLLGVMDGAASDLRPGLPWQGVDIHEPVRLLFVIESTPEAMIQIMNENPTVANICRNGWAQLAVLDPNSPQIKRFVNGQFVDYTPGSTELPAVDSSLEWYRGWRDHLPFALIRNQA